MIVQPTPGSCSEPGGGAETIVSRLALATDACFDCAHACRACADMCIGEEGLAELRSCIQINLDCADVCMATGGVAMRHSSRPRGAAGQEPSCNDRFMELMFDTCAEICRCCEEECMRHAQAHKQCLRCAAICRASIQACLDAARVIKIHTAQF